MERNAVVTDNSSFHSHRCENLTAKKLQASEFICFRQLIVAIRAFWYKTIENEH
jgi:hypothetical protein